MPTLGQLVKSAFVAGAFAVATAASAVSVTPIASYNVAGGLNQNITTTKIATPSYVQNYFYELVAGAHDLLTTFTLVGTSSPTVPVRYFLWEDTNATVGASDIHAIGQPDHVADSGVLLETVPYLTVGQSFQYTLEAGKQYLLQIQKTATNWSSIETNVSAVPLPGALWMFGTALLGFLGFSSRRKV